MRHGDVDCSLHVLSISLLAPAWQEAAEDGSMSMCAEGVSGNAAAGTACVEGEACQDIAGSAGVYGWCHTETSAAGGPGQWGGCTPCTQLAAVKVYVLLDGEPVPRKLRGKDVEEDAFGRTYVAVLEPRIYFVISEYVEPLIPALIPALALTLAPTSARALGPTRTPGL